MIQFKWSLVLLALLSSLGLGQSPQSLREYEEAKASALNGSGTLFVLATTDGCPPCEKAKQLLGQDMRMLRHTLIELPIQDCAKIKFGSSPLIAAKPLLFAPKLLMIDVADLIEGTTVLETGSVTTQSIDYFLSLLPVDLLAPVALEFSDEPPVFGSAARVIRYSIATQYKNGAYNSTFEWGKIDRYLQAFERYWNVDFQRVTRNGNIMFLQSNTNLKGGPTVAAVAGGTTVRISPTFNFRNGPWCGIVTLHETGHLYGGSAHNRDANGLMGPTGGKGSILQSDYHWFRQWQWKPGAKRPHEEPEWLMQWINGTIQGSDGAALSGDKLKDFEFHCPEGAQLLN
jgi:hypothetical protein